MTKGEKIERIKNTARRVLPEGGEAWLFGSQARGNAHRDSDWDILILLDKEMISNEDHDNIAYPFREVGWDFDACINPLIFTKKEWSRNWFSPFFKNVMNERIRL
jgi:predicted nucleotidyltransferase